MKVFQFLSDFFFQPDHQFIGIMLGLYKFSAVFPRLVSQHTIAQIRFEHVGKIIAGGIDHRTINR